MPEQRSTPRHERRLSLQIASEPHGRFEIETVNLSLSGACCRSRYFVPLMTRLRVTMLLPGERAPEPLRADAVVVRVQPATAPGSDGSYDLALYFTQMRPADQDRLGAFLRGWPGGAA
jgi:hypothetical protein